METADSDGRVDRGEGVEAGQKAKIWLARKFFMAGRHLTSEILE
jgi:hypothetical protein